MTGWTFAGTSVEGTRFEIAPGLNVWEHEWVEIMRDPPPPPTGDEIEDIKARFETVFLTDPLYGNDYLFNVYEIVDGGQPVRFAAREFSANLWGFYLPREN